MAEIGIDISCQRAKSLTEYLGKKRFGYLVTVCDQLKTLIDEFVAGQSLP